LNWTFWLLKTSRSRLGKFRFSKGVVSMRYAVRAAGFEHKKPLDDNPYGDFFQRYSYVDFLDDNLVDK